MNEFVKAATHISNPLMLAGLVLAILYFVIKQLTKGKLTAPIQKMLLRFMFILSLVAMVLGCVGWYLGSKRLEFNVYLDNNPFAGAQVTLGNINSTPQVVNASGRVSFELSKDESPARMLVQILHANVEVDTSFSKDSFPSEIHLTSGQFHVGMEGKKNIRVLIYYDGNPQTGVSVQAPEIGVQDVTNRDGMVALKGPDDPTVTQVKLVIRSQHPPIQIDTTVELSGKITSINAPKVVIPPPPRTFSTLITDQDIIRKLEKLTGATWTAGSGNLIEIGYDPAAMTTKSAAGTYTFKGSPVVVFVKHQVCGTIPALYIDALEPSLQPEKLQQYANDRALELIKGADIKTLPRLSGCIN